MTTVEVTYYCVEGTWFYSLRVDREDRALSLPVVENATKEEAKAAALHVARGLGVKDEGWAVLRSEGAEEEYIALEALPEESCPHEQPVTTGVVGHRWCRDCGAIAQKAWGVELVPKNWTLPKREREK